MGTVFEAVDEVLGRRVAIKRLKAVDESGRRRFWREARAIARLSHPNVCQLYEVGEDVSGPFLAMELLSGEPLSLRLRSGPMTAAEVVALGAGMLAALSAIHAAGLVHRDLKPSNVYLTPYGPRLLDFGLVRHLPSDLARMMPSNLATPGPISGTPITDPRNLIGTPGYMAPEQILRPGGGRARRSLRSRHGALRGARGPPRLSRDERPRGAHRDAQPGLRPAARAARAARRRSCAARSPRSRRSASRRRRRWRRRCMRPRRRRRLELVTAPARRTARSSSDARQSSPGCRNAWTARSRARAASSSSPASAAPASRRSWARCCDGCGGRACRLRSWPAAASSTRGRAIRSSRFSTRSGACSARRAVESRRSSSSRPGPRR